MSEEQNQNMNKTAENVRTDARTKLMLAIIAALAVVIVVLIAVIIKKDNNGDNVSTETTVATGTDAETQDASATDGTATDVDAVEVHTETEALESTSEENSTVSDDTATETSESEATSTEITEETTQTTEDTAVTKDNNSTTTEASKNKTSTTQATTEKAANTTSNNASTQSGSVKVVVSNQWESNGYYCGQLDITISNTSSSELKNWTVKLPVSSDTSVESSWNCENEIKSSKLVVSGVDYNTTIAANSKAEGIGIIVKVKKKSELDSMASNAVLYIGGQQSTSSNGGAQSDSSTTEEATTEETSHTVQTETGTPYSNHGKLKVKGTDLVDSSGAKYQLKGVSTHGIAWFPDYVNKSAFKTLRDDWGANLIRIAMYSGENMGYCTGGDQTTLKNLVTTGVDAATELGMYVIIDWHVLGDQNPLTYKDEAKKFFAEMSKKYKNNGNVLYEICNEPNGGTTWADIKKYAEEVIPVIKANNPDAIIIVGTPTWSQDVDQAAADPITGYTNIMYAAHFYAATHTDWLRTRISAAKEAGIPIFISEFSICDASGSGAIDYDQAEEWFDLINDCNLSYAAWSLCNKAETSALISSSCTKTSGWSVSDLSDTGKWIRKKIKGQ